MKIKTTLFLGIIFFSIFISTGLVFSQEQTAGKPPAQQAPLEPEAQWIWGDVVSVDTAAKKMLVKYLDYETDTEKEISIDVEDKTTYENVKSIDEIKPQDTLSIDYAVSSDGRNIAKNVSVEKPESPQALPSETPKEEPKTAPTLE